MGRRSLFAGRTKSIRPDWREWGLPVVTVLWLLTMLSLISLSSRAVILVAGTGFVVLAIFFRWESVFVAVKILLILNALRGLTILIAARTGGMAMLDAFTLPLGLQAVVGLVPGHVSVRVEGPTGTLARVQRSSDLRTWQDWQTVTLGDDGQTLNDPTVGPGEQRYYRAVNP